jgi:5-(aminomethyl)-3-furanmethanol phosphate kinase
MDLVVIKVGGSLALYPQSLRALCKKLSSLSKKQKLVVIPGGGEFTDVVRAVDKRFNLSSAASHRMAILGMDQYGLMLTDLNPEFLAVSDLEEVEKTIVLGKVPVFLPSKILFSKDPLENSWSVTSDSIALFVASQLHAIKLLLITDVDGIFSSDPRKDKWANLLHKVAPTELSELSERTSVDSALPKLLMQWQIDCYVVNGLFPERVEAILEGQESTFSLISGNEP